jgi:hypothetical protein
MPTTSLARYMAILLVCVVIRGLFYRAVTPPWQGPDEPGHFEYVGLIALLGRIPQSEADLLPQLTRDITTSVRTHWYKFIQHGSPDFDYALSQSPPLLAGPREAIVQLPFYYWMLSPVYTLSLNQPLLGTYYILSLISCLMTVTTVALAAYAAQLIFPNGYTAVMAAATLVAFWPMQSFIGSMINNDNLATLFGAVVFAGTARLYRYGWRWATVVVLIGSVASCLLVKRSAFFLIPITMFSVSLFGLRRFFERHPLKLTRLSWLALGLLACVLFYFAPSGFRGAVETLAQVEHPLAQYLLGYVRGLFLWQFPPSPEALTTLPVRVGVGLTNVWSQFSWGRPLLPPVNYQLVGLAVLGAVVGLGRAILRARLGIESLAGWQQSVLLVFGMAILVAFGQILVILALAPRFNPPGRYMMTVLIPMSVLLVAGWCEWIPARWQPLLPQALLAALIVQDAVSLSLTLIPFFYG